jgi:thioredoxin-related protein
MLHQKYTSFFKLVLIFAFALQLNGASLQFTQKMNYETDYSVALQKALKQNKPIMMVIGTKTCPWCRKLENQTLKKDIVHNIVSKEFIALTLHRSKTSYPPQYVAKVVPTVFFIDPKKEKAYHISYGYKNKKIFSQVVEKALKKYKAIK